MGKGSRLEWRAGQCSGIGSRWSAAALTINHINSPVTSSNKFTQRQPGGVVSRHMGDNRGDGAKCLSAAPRCGVLMNYGFQEDGKVCARCPKMREGIKKKRCRDARNMREGVGGGDRCRRQNSR